MRILAVAVLTGCATALPAAAADPVLPLSEVRPGMTGTAHTVVRGTEVVTFPVTVLDVGRGPGPGGSLIVIRADGPLMDETGGIAEGMSGSPVYVTGEDGVDRVIGAIAYGQGDERNRIGGITPIEQMLAVAGGPRALALPQAAAQRPVRVAADEAAAARLRRAEPRARVLVPLRRWSVAGVHPRLSRGLSRRLGTGVQVDAVASRTPRPPAPLEPGRTMTAQVLGGDIALGAIGTVTYVDGPTVLGFGHPFTGAGAVRLLLGDGWIITTVSAPVKGLSYKLGEPGTLQGMITGDRRDGVVGRIGPVQAVQVRTRARDLRRRTTADLDVRMAPQAELVPLVADLLQAEPVLRVRDGVTSGTLSLRITVRGPDLRRPFVYRNVWASAGDTASVSSGALGRILTVLTQNGVREVMPSRIEVEQTLHPAILAGQIQRARVVPATVRPGQRARLVLTLRMWRGGERRVVVPVRIPRHLDPGPAALRVVPNDAGGFDPTFADLSSALGGESAPLGRRTPMTGGLARALQGPGTPRERVLRALRRATDDRHDAVRLLGPGEDAEDRTVGVTVPVPDVVVTGGRGVARIRVR